MEFLKAILSLKKNEMQRFCLFIGLLIANLIVNAQDTIPEFVREKMESYISNALEAWKIPGCAVGIVKDGKVIWARGYGIKDIQYSEPVDEHTLFMIASNTKAVTGICLAQLELEKKLSLDDPVNKWLPGFRLYNPQASAMVNIKDLVTHRLGFETFQGDFCHWATNTSRQGVIDRMAKIVPKYEFRDKYGYCNAGYTAAGEIIKKASGLNWEDYIARIYFERMGLKETRPLSRGFSATQNHCHPHTIYKDELVRLSIPNIDNLAPAASICSSISDWSNWVLMLLEEGKYKGQEIIPQAAIAKSMEALSIVGPFRPRFNTGHFSLYGLGWNLADYEGKKVVSHTGGADGFVTSVTLLPEIELGVLVFTNSDANGFYQALKWEIIDAYLDLPFRDYSDVYLKRYKAFWEKEAQWLKQVEDSSARGISTILPLNAYAGSYKNEVYGSMELKVVDNQIIGSFQHHPGMTATLKHMGQNRFLCTYSNPTFGIKVVPFTLKGNRVESFDLSCADFVDMEIYPFLKQN